MRALAGAVAVLLVVVSILLVSWGIDSLSKATLGVGIICLGVFVAILARIAQAASHHADLMGNRPAAPQPATKSTAKDDAQPWA